ncbi:MAG TPA: TOBE domain-containing protein, partial [Acetobacteraceae bacterium]|nr:TOBE domain-containing protein [Acetobacteraceae bacterium]
VFSDPPLNEAEAARFPFLPPAAARAGFRAEHLMLGPPPPGCFGFEGQVVVTEITGSESYVHVDVGGARWVALARGVVDLPSGEDVQLHIDPMHVMAFDAAGRFVWTVRSGLEAAA